MNDKEKAILFNIMIEEGNKVDWTKTTAIGTVFGIFSGFAKLTGQDFISNPWADEEEEREEVLVDPGYDGILGEG